MNKITTKWAVLTGAITALGISAPATVFATNGMFLIAPGTKARGMGGVAITMTHDTLSSAINPATMAHTGNRFDIGGDILFTSGVSTLGQGTSRETVDSRPEHFTINDGIYLLPNLGASWNFGDISYGFTMVGVGGGGSKYNLNLYNNTASEDPSIPVGVSLLIMDINPTIAMKLDEQNSVGASLIIGLQVFKAFGLGIFTQFTTTQDDTAKLSDNGSQVSYGAGIRLGWLGNYNDGNLVLGAEYTSQTYMSKFDKYSDLFAEQGSLNTPGNIGIGAAYKLNPALTVALDINYVMYDQVPAISNPGPNTVAGPAFPVDRQTNALGRDGGLGFGWDNQTVFKFGAMYQYDPQWVLRAGWNYGKSPIDENQDILFNIVAPATTQHHLTLGGTYSLDQDMEISVSYVHAFRYTQAGPTYIGYEGEISMAQDAIGATFASKF